MQVHVSWEDTSEGWQTRGSVPSFLVGSALAEGNDVLLWEVGDIVHGDSISRRSWLEDLGLWGQDVSLMCFAFAAGWAIRLTE